MTLVSNGLAVDAAEAPPEVVDLEERGWLARHCRGDESAFAALLQAYRRPVYGFLVRSGVAEADRDDLFQTIFLKVHGAAASYDASRPLAPWLFTIVANTVRNHFRQPALSLVPAAADDPAADPQSMADPNPGPERAAAARETVAWLEHALHELPLAQREVVLLVAVAGLPQQEVAEALGLPLNSVKTHLRRARLRLAQGLAERDGTAGCPGDDHEDL